MLRVVPVGVPGDDGDHPVVVPVDQLRRELLDLFDDPIVRSVELAEHVARVAAASPLDHRGVELIRVVHAWLGRAALAELRQPIRGPCLPRRGVRGEVLVRPAGRGALLESGQPHRADRPAEVDPIRLHETDKVIGASDCRADVAVVIGVMPRRIPLDDLERQAVGILGKRADRLEKTVVRRRPPREELLGGLPLRLLRGARVEGVDVVVQLWVFATFEYAGDALRDRLLPRRKVCDVLVETPARAQLFRESLRRQRLDRGSERAIALAVVLTKDLLQDKYLLADGRVCPRALDKSRHEVAATLGRVTECVN